MKNIFTTACLVLTAAFFLTACEQEPDSVEENLEEAAEETQEAAEEGWEETKEAAEEAGDEIEEETDGY